MKDYVGFGALGEALTTLDASGFRRVFVVASRTGWRRFNANGPQMFFPGRECFFFHDFSPNPDFREIQAGAALYEDCRPDLIVAVGGGSAIDVAKAVKAVAHTKKPFDQARPASIQASGEGPPLVAIPTTAGSGSEATPYSVFYVGLLKQSISHPSVRPDIAVVDPELSYSMPPRLTAESGFDALSQGIESYWGAKANAESREYAGRCIQCALPNLYNAVHGPGPANRYNMANAAYLSGRALAITASTLPHGLSYFLTQRYGLAHGHAAALTLPSFFLMNADPGVTVTAPAGPERHQAAMRDLVGLLGQETPEDAVFFWRNLMKHCGLEPTLAGVGVDTDAKLKELIASLDPTRFGNHPVAVDPDIIFRFLKR